MNVGNSSVIANVPLFSIIILVAAIPIITIIVSGATNRLSIGRWYAHIRSIVHPSINAAPIPIAK